MEQRERETLHRTISDVLGTILANRLYVAIELEDYADGFDEELFRDLGVSCSKFELRRESRERRADKCL